MFFRALFRSAKTFTIYKYKYINIVILQNQFRQELTLKTRKARTIHVFKG